MPVPGPSELGRSVIVGPGAAAPAAWADAPRIVVDEIAMADPAATVGALHEAWAGRRAVVIELGVDPATFRAPPSFEAPLWELGPGLEDWRGRLHFLVWANSYDAQGKGDPVWWWARKAARLGATEAGPADVTLSDGTPAWIDGGPRAPLPSPLAGASVVHRESVEVGRLEPQPAPVPPSAELAPDQLAAVAHGAGPARIIAPAGSGKTRVLTERYRHLLVDRGYERESIVALAYNKRAQEEMASRLPGLGARIQTINAWGYSLLGRAWGRRPEVLDERAVRGIVEKLVPSKQRRVNTDPIAPYLDGLSLIRLGLRDPEEVEASLDDVDGLAAAYGPYREELRRRGAIDFDEQVFGAVEALVRDGELRRAIQADHRHLLVDELQDLTPAHVLLVRLAAGPQADVFGVGDDDQVIYAHVGADPRFLIDFARYFPGADVHALEVNYRCPAPVTTAAATLLSYNDVRVAKEIRPGPSARDDSDALVVQTHAADTGARALVDAVQRWIGETAAPAEIAVLTRVQSLLLAPHVALAEAGLPVDSILDEGVLNRLGVRAALAYLRIAVDPDGVSGADLGEVHRRPSRGLPQWAVKWLERCRSVADVRRAAARIDDPKVGARLDSLALDLDRLAGLAGRGASARDLLTAVRDDIGLGSAMTLLDSTGGASGSHLDDLDALLQVADLQPDPERFETWLRTALDGPRASDGDPTADAARGVTLSTVHRVKGREWPHVVVFGADAGIFPHRLAEDVEEERRVFHVAITRGIETVTVLADDDRPSPFLGELDGTAPKQAPRRAAARSSTAPASRGGTGAARTVKTTPAEPDLEGEDLVLFEQLRAWRSEVAKRQGGPAFIIFGDAPLKDIAKARPADLRALSRIKGVGPSKLESYGDDVLEIVARFAT